MGLARNSHDLRTLCSTSCSNRAENVLVLDGLGPPVGHFELKSIVWGRSGREFAEFGTVRPRVQIPGPRPKIVFKSRSSPAPSDARGSQGGHGFSWN